MLLAFQGLATVCHNRRLCVFYKPRIIHKVSCFILFVCYDCLADELGVHFRTVQNWETGTTSIPTTVYLTLDNLFINNVSSDYVSREEYNRVIAALDASTELNKRLTDIIQSSIGGDFNKG